MSYKFKFFPRPIESNINTSIEGFILELFVGIICGGFALYGYETGMIIVFIPAGLIALACFFVCSYTAYQFVA